MKGLALRLWFNPGTVLCKKVGSLFEKGEELKEGSLPVLRRLLGREAHREHGWPSHGRPHGPQAGPRTVIACVVLCGHILGGVFSRGSLSVRAVTAKEGRVTRTSALASKILVFFLRARPWNLSYARYVLIAH